MSLSRVRCTRGGDILHIYFKIVYFERGTRERNLYGERIDTGENRYR